MSLQFLHDPEVIEPFLRRDPYLHLYALGDLDPFHWPLTQWYALGNPLRALALGYFGSSPTILALARPEERTDLATLLRQLRPILPVRFECHLSPGLATNLSPDYRLTPHGRHLKMAMLQAERLESVPSEGDPLGRSDLDELEAFYSQAYPDNWFDPRMLESGHYRGIRRDGVLVSVAGVHVHAPGRKIAALGNIATHPDYRGKGLAAAVTASVCKTLLEQGFEHLGLNVSADNQPAIKCYEQLGFSQWARYEEFSAVFVS